MKSFFIILMLIVILIMGYILFRLLGFWVFLFTIVIFPLIRRFLK